MSRPAIPRRRAKIRDMTQPDKFCGKEHRFSFINYNGRTMPGNHASEAKCADSGPICLRELCAFAQWLCAIAHDLGFGVQVSGFRVRVSGFGFQGSGFRVQGSGFNVQGSGVQVCLFRSKRVRLVAFLSHSPILFIPQPPPSSPTYSSRSVNAGFTRAARSACPPTAMVATSPTTPSATKKGTPPRSIR